MEASSKNEVIHAICGHLFLLKKTQDPAQLYSDIIVLLSAPSGLMLHQYLAPVV